MVIRPRSPASRPAAKATPKRALKPRVKPVAAAAPMLRAGIESLRGRIDAVDRELHALLNERARLAREVGVSKGKQGRLVDFYRPERESQVLRMVLERNAAARAEGTLRDDEVVRLFREIMSACLAQEEPLKVGFLGPKLCSMMCHMHSAIRRGTSEANKAQEPCTYEVIHCCTRKQQTMCRLMHERSKLRMCAAHE